MTNSEYLFKAALKAKKPIFFSFQTSPSAEWWGLERASGAYLGGFYEIFQNDLILLWALLMNGNPIWPQYLGTRSQCWERLTPPPPTLSKPLPPRRRRCRAQGSSREPHERGMAVPCHTQSRMLHHLLSQGHPHSILGWGIIGAWSGLLWEDGGEGVNKLATFSVRLARSGWGPSKKKKKRQLA